MNIKVSKLLILNNKLIIIFTHNIIINIYLLIIFNILLFEFIKLNYILFIYYLLS